MEDIQDFDDILTNLGTGKWNFLYFVGVSSCNFWLPSIIISATYVAPKLDFICHPDSSLTNITHVNECTYETEEKNPYTEEMETQIHQCTRWRYNQSEDLNSMTSEFDLVCSRAYYRPTYTTAYMVGNIIGSPITGFLSDKFGRKPVIWITTLLGIFSVLIAFVFPNMLVIVVARFFTGFGFHSMLLSLYSLFMEVCVPKQRSVMGIYFSLPWSFGTMWWGALGYLIKDWRWLQSASLAPSIVVLLCLCFYDESPRWLIVNGKFDDALKVIKKAAKWNGASLPDENILKTNMKHIQESSLNAFSNNNTELPEEESKKPSTCISKIMTLLHILALLFKTPKLRQITLVMYFVFFAAGMVYYGLSLSATNLDLNPYLFFLVIGLTQVPAYSLTGNIIGKFGRVPPTIFTFLGSGFAILVLAYVSTESKVLVYSFTIMGSMCIAAAFQIIFLSGTEVFPTEVRLQGFATSSFVSSVGAGIAPFIIDILGSQYPWISSFVFGAMSTLAGIASYYIPETLNKKLPETIHQLEMNSKK